MKDDQLDLETAIRNAAPSGGDHDHSCGIRTRGVCDCDLSTNYRAQAVPLSAEHVMAVLGVKYAEIDPDGGVYIGAPWYCYLSPSRVRDVMHHTARKLGTPISHHVTARTTYVSN
jgi:hypothetical protein